jgi:hypothetical protein
MVLLETLLSDWQRWTCGHRWVRARWADGSYGLRCAHCMKPYPRTWNDILDQTPSTATEIPDSASMNGLSVVPAPARRAA